MKQHRCYKFRFLKGHSFITRAVESQYAQLRGRVFCCFATVAFLVLAFLSPQTFGSDGATVAADTEFLRQLTERRLHDLAEQHCQSMMDRSTDAAQHGVWLSRLCDVHEHHFWFLDSPARKYYLAEGIALINTFLNDETVPPELIFQLRIHQLSLLRTSVRISNLLSSAGRLGQNSVKPSVPSRPPSLEINAGSELQRGIELANDLLLQLGRVKNELTAKQTTLLRRRVRLLLVELRLLKNYSRLEGGASVRVTNDDESKKFIKQLASSSGSDRIKYRARWLLTEMQAQIASGVYSRAHINTLKPPGQFRNEMRPEFLSVPRLLQSSQAKDALVILREAGDTTALEQPYFSWLKLEALLSLREMGDQLKDEELTAMAVRQFQEAGKQHDNRQGGVFLEATRLTMKRFDLVNAYGVPVADVLREVDELRAAGDLEAAISRLDAVMNKLSDSEHQKARGALSTTAAEMLIEQKNWRSAYQRLEAALAEPAAGNRSVETAATDLLRIFVIAQLIRDSAGDFSLSQYVTELESHLEEFASAPTAKTAQEWLIKAVSAESPARAADMLAALLESETNPGRQLNQLKELSELLQDLATPQGFQTSINAYTNAVTKLIDDESIPEAELWPLQLRALELDVQFGSVTDWNSLDSRLNVITSSLEKQSEDSPPTVTADQRSRLHLLRTVLECLAPPENHSSNGNPSGLSHLTTAQKTKAVSFLYACGSNAAQSQEAKKRLAELLGSLLAGLTKHSPEHVSTSELVVWLKMTNHLSQNQGLRTAQQNILSDLVNRDLNEQELMTAMQSISELPPDLTGKTTSLAVEQNRFYRHVIERCEQGADAWLEASYRMAAGLAAAGEISAARRQLAILDSIYPDWGGEQRRTRVQTLVKRLAP